MLRSRSTVSAWVANTCWRRSADALDQPQHERVRAAVLECVRGRAVEAQEDARAVAPLLGELRALERRRHRGRHVELAPPRQLREPRDVHRAQLDRRPATARARRRRSRSGRRARAARRARRAPRRAGSRRPTPHVRAGTRALLERGGDHRALVLHRAHEHADLLGRHAVRDQPLGLGRHGLGLRALRAAAPEAHAAAARRR